MTANIIVWSEKNSLNPSYVNKWPSKSRALECYKVSLDRQQLSKLLSTELTITCLKKVLRSWCKSMKFPFRCEVLTSMKSEVLTSMKKVQRTWFILVKVHGWYFDIIKVLEQYYWERTTAFTRPLVIIWNREVSIRDVHVLILWHGKVVWVVNIVKPIIK